MIRTLVICLLLLSGCTAAPPRNPENICSIFREKDDWYADAADAREEWGSPISVMMAIVHQESRFQAKAKPPRKKILGFIPGPRASSAYGYPQAKTETWAEYKRHAGRWGADRDDFADAVDFIGWYNAQSNRRNGIPLRDPYRLYLAYHEGQGGYSRGSFQKKPWLQNVARKVEGRANSYRGQLLNCEDELKSKRGFFGWF